MTAHLRLRCCDKPMACRTGVAPTAATNDRRELQSIRSCWRSGVSANQRGRWSMTASGERFAFGEARLSDPRRHRSCCPKKRGGSTDARKPYRLRVANEEIPARNLRPRRDLLGNNFPWFANREPGPLTSTASGRSKTATSAICGKTSREILQALGVPILETAADRARHARSSNQRISTTCPVSARRADAHRLSAQRQKLLAMVSSGFRNKRPAVLGRQIVSCRPMPAAPSLFRKAASSEQVMKRARCRIPRRHHRDEIRDSEAAQKSKRRFRCGHLGLCLNGAMSIPA